MKTTYLEDFFFFLTLGMLGITPCFNKQTLKYSDFDRQMFTFFMSLEIQGGYSFWHWFRKSRMSGKAKPMQLSWPSFMILRRLLKIRPSWLLSLQESKKAFPGSPT